MAFPFLLLFAGISAAASIGGLALQAAGTAVQMDAAKKQTDASVRAERLRERQMNLESMRQRRQAVRNAIKARSVALSSATSQGATGTGSSGIAGGLGQIASQGADNVRSVNNAQEIGKGIFDANADYATAGGQMAMGQGLSSLGGALVNNAGQIGQIGTFFGSPKGK
jgi:hypothetical protein